MKMLLTLSDKEMIDLTVASRITGTVSVNPVCFCAVSVDMHICWVEIRTKLGQILSTTVFLSSLSEYSGR